MGHFFSLFPSPYIPVCCEVTIGRMGMLDYDWHRAFEMPRFTAYLVTRLGRNEPSRASLKKQFLDFHALFSLCYQISALFIHEPLPRIAYSDCHNPKLAALTQ